MTLIKSTADVSSCYACHLSLLSELRSHPITHHSAGRLLSAALVTLWFLEPIRALIEHLFGLLKHHWRMAFSCSFWIFFFHCRCCCCCCCQALTLFLGPGSVGSRTEWRPDKTKVSQMEDWWLFLINIVGNWSPVITHWPHCPVKYVRRNTIKWQTVCCRLLQSVILWSNGTKTKGSGLGWVIENSYIISFLKVALHFLSHHV